MSLRLGVTLVALVGIGQLISGCAPMVVAGMGTGALMVQDRRTSGAFVEDEVIENKIQHRIYQRYGYRAHVSAVSFNHNVLLAGQIPNQEALRDIERLARGVEHVRQVYNETQVAPVLSLGARSTDTYITSKVKARFLDNAKFAATHVKVFTEDATVYLLGIVTREEADEASDIARSTDGVKKVVRLFEYGTRDDLTRTREDVAPRPFSRDSEEQNER
jgi:osmotically-inducible protein OsmY